MKRTNRHPAEALAEATADRYRDMAVNGWRDFTGSITLDSFIATKDEARARVWQAASADDRRGLVMQALRSKGDDFDNAIVEFHVEKHNARYGDALPTTEALVVEELTRTADNEALHARSARAAGERHHARDYQRAANAASRALVQFRAGVRPESLGTNKWLLPSQRGKNEAPHILTLEAGQWICTCSAGATAHWALALIIAQETAADQPLPFEPTIEDVVEAEPLTGTCDWHGSYTGDSCRRCAVVSLGRRIAQARASVGWATA